MRDGIQPLIIEIEALWDYAQSKLPPGERKRIDGTSYPNGTGVEVGRYRGRQLSLFPGLAVEFPILDGVRRRRGRPPGAPW